MNIIKCYLVNNDCYKAGKYLNPPTKIVVHSTGAANANLKRYVQPANGQADADELVKVLGKNSNGNSWNRSSVGACVNAFVGKLADGSLAVAQTLPWNMRAWGVGSGKLGSYNNYAIQFEICEDNRTSKEYCEQTYALAADLCAELIRQFPNITPADIVSHAETYKLGYGSNHGDPDDWWKLFNLSMDKFRRRVEELLQPKEDETEVRYYKMIEVPKWYKPTIAKLIEKGLLSGKGGTGDDMIVDVSEDMCRTLTVLDRAGVFDK